MFECEIDVVDFQRQILIDENANDAAVIAVTDFLFKYIEQISKTKGSVVHLFDKYSNSIGHWFMDTIALDEVQLKDLCIGQAAQIFHHGMGVSK